MKSFLTAAFEALESKLGGVASFIPVLAEGIKKGIDEEDFAAIDKHLREAEKRIHEGRETLTAAEELTAHVRQSVRDGDLSLAEAGQGLLLVERLIDEAEDVVTGVDEDDEPAPVEPEEEETP